MTGRHSFHSDRIRGTRKSYSGNTEGCIQVMEYSSLAYADLLQISLSLAAGFLLSNSISLKCAYSINAERDKSHRSW